MGRLATAAIAAALVACSTSSGGGSDASAGTPCGDYFDAIVIGVCDTGPTLPDDELARDRARFEKVCLASLALPGSTVTQVQLEACAQAIHAAGCTGRPGVPGACLFAGTLAPGSACNEDFQCQSALCFAAAPVGDAGAGTVGGCGKCEPVASVGQSCAMETCAQGTVCDPTKMPSTCATVTSGGVGAACNGATTVCDVGFFCDVSTMKCTAQHPPGHACTGSSECTAPATCRSKTCASPSQAGGGCYIDTDCVAGLGCSMSETCGAITWASAGQPCGDLARCLVGACSSTGKCPAVVADGQTCPTDDAHTCDSISLCINGVCTLEDTVACK
ncbi:MAG TPA: hypothetical protein VF765_32580 [Polyangiaceae bacterium]